MWCLNKGWEHSKESVYTKPVLGPPERACLKKWAACGVRKSLATEQVTVVSTWRELVFTKLLRVLI